MKNILVTLAAAVLSLAAAAQTKAPAQRRAEAQAKTQAPAASAAAGANTAGAGKGSSVDLSPFLVKEYKKDGLTLPYRILYPENMQKGGKYPLFLFLHGMGKRGTDNVQQLDRGGELFLTPENRTAYPCVALYPQAPKTSAFVEIVGEGNVVATSGFTKFVQEQGNKSKLSVRISPYGQMVLDVVNQLIASGIIDTNRIYISGSSMGGFSTYQFITQYPELFAAAAPIAGATDLSTMSAWAGKVPIWIFHGADDPTVPVSGDRAVVAKLKEMGVTNFKYTEYPKTGHDSWTQAFAEPDYLKWFFSHSKKTAK